MPNQQTLVAHIRELIGNGKLKQALTELNTWTENNADEDTQQTATLHLASYTNNERSNSMNFITRDEYLRETARINNAVLTLLNDLQHTPKKRNKSTSEPTTTNPVHNIYNIGSIHDANFGTSVHGSKNVNTGNISAGGSMTIGDGNNAGVETFKNKKTSWWIGAAAAMAGLIAFIANIGAIKESFFLKEQPKVIAAPPVNYKNEGLLPLDTVIAQAERKRQEVPKVLKGLGKRINIKAAENNTPSINVGRDMNGTVINNGTTTNNFGTKKYKD